jgi:hypothetical protein
MNRFRVLILDVLQELVEAKNSFASFLPADSVAPIFCVVWITRRIAE